MTFFVVVVALPAIAALLYLVTHPGYLSYTGRPFDIWERLLTETRVLWLYLRLILIPDISLMGLFHDDFTVSKGFFAPASTLAATVAWLTTLAAAFALRKRLPLFSFAVLFFLAGHLLESTIFPLELVYEHRNHLPSLGILFAIAAIPTALADRLPVRRLLLYLLFAALVVAYGSMTAMRSIDWSSEPRFMFREVENHPDSSRANFRVAQLLLTVADPAWREYALGVARLHFEHVHESDPHDVDGLFGLMVLDLEEGRVPDDNLVDTLVSRLETIPINPLNVTLDHFPFFVRMAQSSEAKERIRTEHLMKLADAALANPTMPAAGRVIIYNSLRQYYLTVLRDAETALDYAELAVKADPSIWGMHDRQIRLLAAMRRFEAAEESLRSAEEMDRAGFYRREARELEEVIADARRGEPVMVAPKGKDI
jgi:hypothetical protein